VSERRTRKMVNLAIEETSGVDHPAHLTEGWLVMKAADPSEVDELIDGNDAQEGQMEKSTEERLEEALAALAKAEERLAELEKGMAPADDDDETMKMEDEDEDEDMMKSAPEPVRKAFEAMEKAATEALAKAEAAEATLRKERAERADAEAVEKARESFANLGLDAAVVGPALRRLADTDEVLAKAVETALTSANAKVESADIFTEIGRSSVQTGSAFHKAESLAKSAVSGGTAATFEQALADVFMSDPSLYNEYLAEKEG
jgi:hypothetical protein